MTQITLLDGGMGQELIHRAGDRPTPLWSTQVMAEHPGMVQGVHADFFAAGATIATTNTYAIHRDRLEDTALEGRFEALHATALAEAKAARAAHGAGRIAGGIGPLRASYRPDLHPEPEVAVPLFAEVAGLLAPECDLLILETCASVAHARDALAGARTTDLPVWLSLTVSDTDGTQLRSGEPLADALEVAAGADAVLINCAAPEAVTEALPIIAPLGKPFGGYANAFEQITEDFLKAKPTVEALTARRDMGPRAYAGYVLQWVGLGATIVGGCCEVSPAHIAEIARRLRAVGHTIV
ncbi:homocysteine S-methyltransferase family protein [Roseobacter sinensis]|uniref:Homocysteine S-methyltransferase family protein n=1 Tax=Roseobacter sinensis TaxID=2931391 RepID=A0ABT3B9H5_9RHOB|nr:homocysteine S-methyltransferase family protein [Roseobacter sp. WL0113]MCV3270231.1 homocysteine S-methyltransferase family protein [Roseobacter sp. WL0113]